MEREIDLASVSDGKLYGANDLVKVGCNDCEGCSDCCRGMGNTILLDPYDIWQFAAGLHLTVEELLAEGWIELNMADGVILPNLKLAGEEEKCTFLNEAGRCSIHAFRPGICRLFPLGRIYEDASFRYFLQVNECSRTGRTKMKVKKWLGIPDLGKYERFIQDWHDYLAEVRREVKSCGDEARIKELNMELLKRFYLLSYDGESDFFPQFYARKLSGKF